MKIKNALLLGASVVLFDFLIKAWIQANIPLLNSYPLFPYGGIGVFKNLFGVQFSIVHTTNTGAAWGFLGSWPQLLVAIRILFVMILVGWAYLSKGGKILFPLTLIISGAIGNLVDFFVYGHVIDYLYFGFFGWPYPIFNLADSCICVGVVLLFFKTYGKKPAPSCEKSG